tara:strand:- start:634 stop:1335 length:702 start_codon:yes stop_codon:yes gene_type:complete
MRRFYHPHLPSIGQNIILGEKASHHLLRVVGISRNEEVEIFDGKSRACIAILQDVKNKSAVLELIKEQDVPPKDNMEYWLLVALVRPDPFSNILRMATEIGVHHIVPFHCTRSVQRGGKRERWEKIILSAVQQCGRYDIPKLHDVQHFEAALALVADVEKKWIFHTSNHEENMDFPQLATNKKAVIVGPEGGFTTDEVVLAKQKKCMQKVLGSSILRTDTAVAVILSQIKFGI